MPLPNIVSGAARRCRAKCKARGGEQCRNPAAFGMAVCRYHGSRKPDTIKSGMRHWNYQHGCETLQSKLYRSRVLNELRELEELAFSLGLASGARWRGRKPRSR